MWENGKITKLGNLPNNTQVNYAKVSYGGGINNRGEVVGVSSFNSTLRAFLWDKGRMRNLDPNPGQTARSYATDINNKREVVGTLEPENDLPVAALWKNGKTINLGNLGGSVSGTIRINNKEQVIGTSMNGGAAFRAFLWQNGKMTDLGSFKNGWSSAEGINDAGKIVGTADYDTPGWHATLWYNGTMTDLNSLIPPNSGWVINFAHAINNRGQIVGTGTFNGYSHGVLLTPVRVTQ